MDGRNQDQYETVYHQMMHRDMDKFCNLKRGDWYKHIETHAVTYRTEENIRMYQHVQKPGDGYKSIEDDIIEYKKRIESHGDWYKYIEGDNVVYSKVIESRGDFTLWIVKFTNPRWPCASPATEFGPPDAPVFVKRRS